MFTPKLNIMSNFEKKFNGPKMKNYRWPIVFAVLGVFGIAAYHFPIPTLIVAAIVIVGIIVKVEVSKAKDRK